MNTRITLASSIHLLKADNYIKDYPETILMNDFRSKRTGGQRRKITEIEDRTKNNWKRNLLEGFEETKEGTRKIDKIREKHMIGNEVFLNMNSELWKHAPLSYTWTLRCLSSPSK